MSSNSSNNQTIFDVQDLASLFKWPEYCVFVAVLVISMGIGVFYGFFDKKNRTHEEFLMASRSMSVFPVTLSLICRFLIVLFFIVNTIQVKCMSLLNFVKFQNLTFSVLFRPLRFWEHAWKFFITVSFMCFLHYPSCQWR